MPYSKEAVKRYSELFKMAYEKLALKFAPKEKAPEKGKR